ncbi:asparagine synthase (glutamine-hydrolyzing) [Vibrio sp. HN007]|uniref:asparagine synthase (glutamine-hydrolyzing) n=1 Tax=Vibrio iocasae TaxID=3098914 RepID=UPI0035D3E84B
MCGIAGIIPSDNLSKTRIQSMLSLMSHRGPDGSDIWEDEFAAIGHCRLAINDLSDTGRQPMVDSHNGIVISVNGEIYNYLQLKSELEEIGYKFKSTSDSEVVLYAWNEWKEDCFVKFNGMFAIAIYDKSIKSLILARDRLGIKPLYYSTSSNRQFSFASEIKALRSLNYSNSVDFEGFRQYFTYQNYFDGRTLNEGISSLKPGSFMVIDRNGDIEEAEYYKLNFSYDTTLSFDDVVEKYRECLDNAVERHLLSDVPVASYLSAGFDSASVANRAGKIGSRPTCFTGRFSESGWYDETSFAKKQADSDGAKHVAVDISYHDLPRVFDKLVYQLDDPMMGMGAFSQYCVAEKVAETHKVILTGHGGDELFSGYPVFKLAYILDSLKYNYGRGLKGLGVRASELPHIVFFILQQFRSNEYRQFFPVLNDPSIMEQALNKNSLENVSAYKSDSWTIGARNKQELLYTNYLNHYLNGLLTVEDKISMAHSLESRTPLLDNEMLDLSLQVPWSLKLNGGTLKSVIKAGAVGRLLPEIYQQPKRGFPTPLRFWLRGPLKKWFETRLTGADSGLRLLFNEEWLIKVCSSYLNSPKQHIRPLDEIQSHRMWQLLCIESWIRQNINVNT